MECGGNSVKLSGAVRLAGLFAWVGFVGLLQN